MLIEVYNHAGTQETVVKKDDVADVFIRFPGMYSLWGPVQTVSAVLANYLRLGIEDS